MPAKERAQPKLYTSLASWFHLLTDPDDYAEEARFFRRLLLQYAKPRPRTVLELGSGGGNNASHMKRWFDMTLSDMSPQMLKLSRWINPDCRHIRGDMRTLRLNRQFDAVFAHDALMYMTTERDLRAAIETAYVHTRPGGAAVFAPDCTLEGFRPQSDCGGGDGVDGRSLRYLEWTWRPGPTKNSFHADFAYLIREPNCKVRVEYDPHTFGVFPKADWLRFLREAGFRPRYRTFQHSDAGKLVAFVAVRPA